MKNAALLFSLVFLANLAAAQESKPASHADKTSPSPKAATKAPSTTHEGQAEVVSGDASQSTSTIKGEPDNKTVPVDAKALASVKELKAGEKVTLVCRDNDKGEHQAVVGVKHAHAEKH